MFSKQHIISYLLSLSLVINLSVFSLNSIPNQTYSVNTTWIASQSLEFAHEHLYNISIENQNYFSEFTFIEFSFYQFLDQQNKNYCTSYIAQKVYFLSNPLDFFRLIPKDQHLKTYDYIG